MKQSKNKRIKSVTDNMLKFLSDITSEIRLKELSY